NGSSIEAVRPVAAEKQVVAFTPWGAANKIGDFTFKASHEADEEARAIARKAVADMTLKRLGIVYLQNDFGVVHEAAFRNEVEKLGGELVASEPIPFPAADFRTILTKVKNANPDGLYIVHNGAIVGQITKQAAELGLKAQYFGQYATESSDLVNAGGQSLEGLIYTFPIDEANLSEKQRDFIAKFEAKVGGKPQVAAYNAYDIYSIYVDVLKACKPSDSQCMRDYVMSLESYDGVSGKMVFEEGRLNRNFFFKTIRNGQLVAL
ncbi:MAG: ABC transporter substrate-binding protein, partial [Patescibacteria group bacterium]